jgi:hypothetical protein
VNATKRKRFANRKPDPTTAGDFCRRFDINHIGTLQDVFNETRAKVWGQQFLFDDMKSCGLSRRR